MFILFELFDTWSLYSGHLRIASAFLGYSVSWWRSSERGSHVGINADYKQIRQTAVSLLKSLRVDACNRLATTRDITETYNDLH